MESSFTLHQGSVSRNRTEMHKKLSQNTLIRHSYSMRIKVSGVLCIAQASFMGEFVQGSLSCSRSCKNHSFKFKKLSGRTQNMKDELERLYFDTVKSKGTKQIKLFALEEAELSTGNEEARYLLFIKGAQARLVSLHLMIRGNFLQVNIKVPGSERKITNKFALH